MADIMTIQTPSLGDRSYLVTDGAAAFVVDPQRDIDRVLALTASRGIAVTHVFETHIHNDYLTGGLALARATGAAYHVNAADKVAFGRVAITGGSLLHGSTGRPDLLGAEHTPFLAAAQHSSVRRLAAKLPDDVTVDPTHGFGSFCAATAAGAGGSTIGEERRVNPALALDEDSYVERLLAGLDDYPAYYARMAPANAAGPAAPDLTQRPVSGADQISGRIAAGEWVVDLHCRRPFAAGHLPGSPSGQARPAGHRPGRAPQAGMVSQPHPGRTAHSPAPPA